MESSHAINTGTLISLSEQNLVSCSFGDHNLGCSGGWYYWDWNYAANHPLMTEKDYPYTSGSGGDGECLYDQKGLVRVLSQTKVQAKTKDIMSAVA